MLFRSVVVIVSDGVSVSESVVVSTEFVDTVSDGVSVSLTVVVN